MKTHDKAYFFKYMNADTAAKILGALSVRWSSPVLFNDPFDTQIPPAFGFDPEEAVEPLHRGFEKLIFADAEPPYATMNPKAALAIRMARAVRDRAPRDQIVNGSREALGEGAANVRAYQEAVSAGWRDYVSRMRVFCVSEVHDDLLMWAHYADCHRGVVIKLNCVEQLDTALCAARPIIYRDDVPVIANLEQWVRHLTGQEQMTFDGLFFDLAFRKSTHWAYEKEWRCWVLAREGDSGLVETNLLYPEEVGAVYLGCMSSQERERVLGTLRDPLRHVEVWQATRKTREFGLEFERVK